MLKNKVLLRIALLSFSLFLVSGHAQYSQAWKPFKKIAKAVSKPLKKLRNWTGKQIYKLSGADRVFRGAEDMIEKAEKSADKTIKKAGDEARKVLNKAKADVKELINDFDKLKTRTLKEAQKLADDIDKKISKHLNKIDVLLTKADKMIGKHLGTVVELQKRLNRDVKERIKQFGELLKEVGEKAEKIVKNSIDRMGMEMNAFSQDLQRVTEAARSLSSMTITKGGIEGAAALAHLRYNIVKFFMKAGKSYLFNGLELSVGKVSPAIVRVFPSGPFTKDSPFKKLTLVYQDFPREDLSGRLKAYLLRKRDRQRTALNVILIDKVKMHVFLFKGTLSPGKYSLHIKIYRSKKMKTLEVKQPPPVEILQEKGEIPVLRYQVHYKNKSYPKTGFKSRKLTNYHDVEKIDTLPYEVDSLLDAKINLSLTNSGGRGVGKRVFGSRDVKYSIWGHNVRLYLQSVSKKCFGKVVTQPLKQAKGLFWALNKKASARKLKGSCEEKNYRELKKFIFTHFMGKTSHSTVTYTSYSLKPQIGVFLQFTSSKR